ncbi:hypothetical protein ACJMK2_033189 [Sinanodonta woodiana]|uniref:Uncharacterized protein n=1 Tax=Sinanodonta woodiana TaxID=1069815 RepID=A0ABD3X7L2_SINWO
MFSPSAATIIAMMIMIKIIIKNKCLMPEHKTYVTDAISQNPFVIKTWIYSGFSTFITVTNRKQLLLRTLFEGVSSKEPQNGLLIQYNNSTKEVSLLLNNVDRGDEGVYQISTSIYQTTAERSVILDNKWVVQLNVLEQGEVKQGYMGENILISEFVLKSIFFPRLYHNGRIIAVLRGPECNVSTNAPFDGRIRCSKDKEINITRIEIKNVTENDTGLYKLITEDSLTWRCFLNITGTDKTSTNMLNSATAPTKSKVVDSDCYNIETLPTTVLSRTPVNAANSMSVPVPIYMIPVIIGADGVILLIGGLAWCQRRKINRKKAVQHIPQHESDPSLYLTPISLEPPLTLSTCLDRKTGLSNIAQNIHIELSTEAQIISMNGYEAVEISNYANTPELEEVLNLSTEKCNTPYSDTSGYLTVMARIETTV